MIILDGTTEMELDPNLVPRAVNKAARAFSRAGPDAS